MFGIERLKKSVLELTAWIIALRKEFIELRRDVNIHQYKSEKCPEEAQGESCLTRADFFFKINEITNKMSELYEFFNSEDEYNSFNRIHDKLTLLLDDKKRLEQVELSRKTLDKFDDYMKNVDKLNIMVNEVKGVSAMTRATIKENKYVSQECFDYSIGDIIARLDQRNGDHAKWAGHSYEKMNHLMEKLDEMQEKINGFSDGLGKRNLEQVMQYSFMYDKLCESIDYHLSHSTQMFEKMVSIEAQIKKINKTSAPRKRTVKKKTVSVTPTKKKFTPAEV